MTLGSLVYNYCLDRYGQKDARYDVIVECMTESEIERELEYSGIDIIESAYQWADKFARIQHEVELNQAWDGPESCVGSSKYFPSE